MLERITKFYLAPQDDIKTAFLDFIRSAKKTIHIEIYGFTLEELIELLIEKQKEGVWIGILLDRSQAGGSTEKEQIEKIKESGIEYYIGVSPKHQIRHSKFAVIDGEWVEDGSLNYSKTSFDQNNTVRISKDKELADLLIADWEDNRKWIMNLPSASPSSLKEGMD
jgi:phosphatidylserine/phosphatidylglycerophosphate/cardiolipin synthase-like enzyme